MEHRGSSQKCHTRLPHTFATWRFPRSLRPRQRRFAQIDLGVCNGELAMLVQNLVIPRDAGPGFVGGSTNTRPARLWPLAQGSWHWAPLVGRHRFKSKQAQRAPIVSGVRGSGCREDAERPLFTCTARRAQLCKAIARQSGNAFLSDDCEWLKTEAADTDPLFNSNPNQHSEPWKCWSLPSTGC